jgi:hypothetical protein
MTIKLFNQGSLSLSEIQTEFGGSGEIGLNEYYAGNGLVNPGTVGYPSGSAVAIPSSGAISISNFYGASAEPSAVALANYFWDNRANLVRYGDDHAPYNNSYPGDFWQRNSPNGRYGSSKTNTWSYANSGLPITSSFFTMISISVGNIGNYPTMSASASPGSLLQQYGPFQYVGDGDQPTVVGNGFGLQAITQTYQGQINTVTSNSITSSRNPANSGMWNHSYLIPGKWRFQNGEGYINFDASNGYARSVGAGKIHVLVAERGGNGPNPLPTPLHTYASGQYAGTNTMTADQWWYNGGGSQLTVNTNNVDLWTSWAASGPYMSDRPYISAILENYQ